MKYWRTRAADPATTGVDMDVPCMGSGGRGETPVKTLPVGMPGQVLQWRF